jgi:hypothetical protein
MFLTQRPTREFYLKKLPDSAEGTPLVLDTMIPPHIDTALVARLAVVRREIPRDGAPADRAPGATQHARGAGGAPRGGDARTEDSGDERGRVWRREGRVPVCVNPSMFLNTACQIR